MKTKKKLPPNPYTLQPIIKSAFLAGRSEELQKIEYYLDLTSSSASNHLALIGERGIGKTSLLNSAATLAVKTKMLPIRIQMNEDVSRSQGRFWKELYATMSQAIAKIGGWGGETGKLYESLFLMIHAGQTVSLDKAILQLPYALANNQGNIDNFQCSDALILRDIKFALEEVRTKDFNGIVFLIDEANCLGSNVSLIQQFRNIFQQLENCSLILAGTEAIFPTLTEVFSPIPRQFHRISVKRFTHFSGSIELINRPFQEEIYKGVKDIFPDLSVMRRLHEICSGSPSELQLYCHHMYKEVEETEFEKMELRPQIYREVLNAYKAGTTSDIGGVTSAIEKLPDNLLFGSNWLSRKTLTLEENIKVEIFSRILEGDLVTEDIELEISDVVKKSYSELFKSGIISNEFKLDLVGDSFTEGFWKSYVEVEKGKTWIWNNDNFDDALFNTLMSLIIKEIDAVFTKPIKDSEENILDILKKFREGKGKLSFKRNNAYDLIISTILGRRYEAPIYTASDTILKLNHENISKPFLVRCLGENCDNMQDILGEFISTHEKTLQSFNISIEVESPQIWNLLSNEEVLRLANKINIIVPEDLFGKSLYDRAITAFSQGDIDTTIATFEMMLEDDSDGDIRNNLAFCYMVEGQYDKALEYLQEILPNETVEADNLSLPYSPLWDNNLSLLNYLLSDTDKAPIFLRRALTWLNHSKTQNDPFDVRNVAYILMLSTDLQTITAQPVVPVDVALLLNLGIMTKTPTEEIQKQIEELYPDESGNWLHLLI